MISREMIQERLSALDQQERQLLADLNAVHGGKQTLQSLLAEIEKLEANKVPKPKRTRTARKQRCLTLLPTTEGKDSQAPTPGSNES